MMFFLCYVVLFSKQLLYFTLCGDISGSFEHISHVCVGGRAEDMIYK